MVDAYAAQHPGDGRDRRDRPSIFVHLIGLWASLEGGCSASAATDAIRRALLGRPDFPFLARAGGPGELTIATMGGALDVADYTARAEIWARSVWGAWADHHRAIRAATAGVSRSTA